MWLCNSAIKSAKEFNGTTLLEVLIDCVADFNQFCAWTESPFCCCRCLLCLGENADTLAIGTELFSLCNGTGASLLPVVPAHHVADFNQCRIWTESPSLCRHCCLLRLGGNAVYLANGGEELFSLWNGIGAAHLPAIPATASFFVTLSRTSGAKLTRPALHQPNTFQCSNQSSPIRG